MALGDLSSSSSTSELHVLAVDDSIVDRKVIERLLRISACKVTTVESGTRALQYLGLDGDKGSSGLKDLKVNLIVTDYSMPGLTGYELLKKIKESSAFREIPVVIMSSENIQPRIEQCMTEGAEDFLLKPVKLADVKRLKELIMRGEATAVLSQTLNNNTQRNFLGGLSTPMAFSATLSQLSSLSTISSSLPLSSRSFPLRSQTQFRVKAEAEKQSTETKSEGEASPAATKTPKTLPKKPVYSMKKGQIVRVDKEKYLNSINYLSVGHPPFYKGLDYIYEDRGEVLDMRVFETGEYALVGWVGIPTAPAWLPTDMLIKSEKLVYERL
ncbi:hypothetical protein IGI04_028846 [Brassica rapa subsp. trilocularis]|uniref:Response regulatory domain-containing protein n=1 Tax=Brassica rapa subsp. trilocularis TaxID=1813537 RepID=A0ABQ7L2X6_BRACM|nr:hypothetical protein IGI04_028846 [Brassica rapa subsp. trilocularis]